MIFAKEMKEKADKFNAEQLESLFPDITKITPEIIAETEDRIEWAASKGGYSTRTPNLITQLEGVLGPSMPTGNLKSELLNKLAGMVSDYFQKNGFKTTKEIPIDFSSFCVKVSWGNNKD